MKYASEKIFYTPKADDLKTSHRLLSDGRVSNLFQKRIQSRYC